MLTVLTPWSGT
jgi:hypothetical protein